MGAQADDKGEEARPAKGPLSWVFSLQRSNGGVPKLAVREALVTASGLEGDWQSDQKHHGGPDRALCLYALDRIAALQREGHPVFPGSLGENVTIMGLNWTRIAPGARIHLGAVVVEVTDYASPCSTIAESFHDRRVARISQKVHPGWSRVYTRVLMPGLLRVGDKVVLEPSINLTMV